MRDALIDGFSKDGADILATTIMGYWQSQGYNTVHAWPYRLAGRPDWGVRSNLVAGMPSDHFYNIEEVA